MGAQVELGERILARLAGINARRPVIQTAKAEGHLLGYLVGLGLEPTAVRWLPDLDSLSRERLWPRYEVGTLRSYMGRHHALFRPFLGKQPRRRERQLWAFARRDRVVLDAGLGVSQRVRSVRRLVPLVHQAGAVLAAGRPLPRSRERYLPALEELSLAAAAGTLAFAIGRESEIVAVPRPLLRLNRRGQLHNWDGLPAVEWLWGGKHLYFWQGVRMTESAGRNPDKVTARRALGWADAECRRVALERLGWERALAQLHGEVVQQDDYGRLWRIQPSGPRTSWGIPTVPEPIVLVEVVNATEERDGSRRRYYLRVPPSVRSARQAVAWTFGISRVRDYELAAEA
jgi:hypothetical protein